MGDSLSYLIVSCLREVVAMRELNVSVVLML